MAQRKAHGKRADRKISRKRVRRAARQALGGGRSRLVRPDRWRQRPEQPVVVDDGE